MVALSNESESGQRFVEPARVLRGFWLVIRQPRSVMVLPRAEVPSERWRLVLAGAQMAGDMVAGHTRHVEHALARNQSRRGKIDGPAFSSFDALACRR